MYVLNNSGSGEMPGAIQNPENQVIHYYSGFNRRGGVIRNLISIPLYWLQKKCSRRVQLKI